MTAGSLRSLIGYIRLQRQLQPGEGIGLAQLFDALGGGWISNILTIQEQLGFFVLLGCQGRFYF